MGTMGSGRGVAWTKGLSALLAAMLVVLALSGEAAAASSSAPPAGPVFVLHTGSAKLGSEQGRLRVLRLNAVSADVTTVAEGGAPEINVETRELVKNWHDLGFDRDPPRAVVNPGRRGQNVAVTLSRPRLESRGSRLVFRARQIRSAGGRLIGHGQNVSRSSLPSRLGFSTLHVDAADGDPAVLEAIADPASTDSNDGFWLEFHTFIDAWAGDGACNYDWGKGNGSCYGSFTRGGTDPFNRASSSLFGYVDWVDGVKSVSMTVGTGRKEIAVLNGRLSDRGSPRYYVDDTSWLWRPHLGVKTGSDPELLQKPGGPLGLNVQYHSAGPFGDGYTFEVVGGYLWCTGPNLCRNS